MTQSDLRRIYNKIKEAKYSYDRLDIGTGNSKLNILLSDLERDMARSKRRVSTVNETKNPDDCVCPACKHDTAKFVATTECEEGLTHVYECHKCGNFFSAGVLAE